VVNPQDTTLAQAVDRAATAQRDVIEAARKAAAEAKAAQPAPPQPAPPAPGRRP
jgi:hypothetical protein